MLRRCTVVCVLVAACGTGNVPVVPPAGPCRTDLDCAPVEICSSGLCVVVSPVPSPDGSAVADAGAVDGGEPVDASIAFDGSVADAGSLDAGSPDAGIRPDGGTPRFCSPCQTDGDCGSLRCVTTEIAGERFCSPRCEMTDQCPGDAVCANFLVEGGEAFCLPREGTCQRSPCPGQPCPAQAPLCDSASGRCYRSEEKPPCASCDHSFECGGLWDRCLRFPGGERRCATDCDSSRGGTCGSGYRCLEVTAPTQEMVNQCVPLTASCDGCRSDNPCDQDRTCDIVTGTCVDSSQVVAPCTACSNNMSCGPTRNTCYFEHCAPYCDPSTPCPDDYTCSAVFDLELGATVARCVPTAGTCN